MGDPVGLLPPLKKLYVGVSLHTARIILRCPERHPFLLIPQQRGPGLVHARANEHRPQQQGTMTNRHRASTFYLFNIHIVMVEGFLSLRARDARGVRAFRTTTGRSWADPAPKQKGGKGGRGPGLSYKEGCRKRTRPPISFDVPGQGPARFDRPMRRADLL